MRRSLDARFWILLGAALLVAYLTLLPLGMLLYGSLRSGAAGDPGAAYTLANYVRAYLDPALYRLFLNSILYAAGTCLVSFLIGTYLAWVSERTNTPKSKIPGRALLDNLTFIPIAFPGIVLGVSLIWVSLTLMPLMYGTFWILLIAYMTRFMPYGIRAASASMIQINAELEEAALISGGSWRQTFQKVVLSLLMPGFVAGWIYISIVSLRELSTSILLYSPQSIVLSILAFDMWEGGQYNYVTALGVLMVLVLIVMAAVARGLGAKVGVVQ